MIARPRCAAIDSATSLRSSLAVPTVTIWAPSAATRSRLIVGASDGMTMTAGTPRSFAARATPWAWLPDEYEMTPRARASGVKDAIIAYAPRSLKAPMGWSDSAFRNRRSSGAAEGDQRGLDDDAPQALGGGADVVDGDERGDVGRWS